MQDIKASAHLPPLRKSILLRLSESLLIYKPI